MAFAHGKLGEFTVNSKDISAFCNSMDIAIEIDTAETTTFAAAWKTFLAGVAGATISVAGGWTPTTTTGVASVMGTIISGAAAVPFVAEPGGAALNQGRTGNCILESYNEVATVGDWVSFTASFKVDGAIAFES